MCFSIGRRRRRRIIIIIKENNVKMRDAPVKVKRERLQIYTAALSVI